MTSSNDWLPDAGAVTDGQPGDRLPAPGLAPAWQGRLRPGDQPLPVPNDGPSMHDLVIEDLGDWEAPQPDIDAIADLLRERKQLGLSRYGSILQAHNHRDFRRDLREELADAAVYARQGLEELGSDDAEGNLGEVYDHILSALFWLQKIPGAAS